MNSGSQIARTGKPRNKRQKHERSAIAWVGKDETIVAGIGEGGHTAVEEVLARTGSAGEAHYMARVVDALGDRDRIVVIGPDELRLELEREYVAIYKRPDRIFDAGQ